MTTVEPLAPRAIFKQHGMRGVVGLPDALMAVVFALAAVSELLTPEQLVVMPWLIGYRDELGLALMAEGAFLMMQGTLVDIATRLRKRPPVWLIPIIVGAVLLFSGGHALALVRMAWSQGLVVFLPLLLTLGQRATVLWHMPDRSRLEKIAARALIANRITTGLALLGVVTAMMISGTIFPQHYNVLAGMWSWFAAGAIYFAVAAFDDWRVRGRRFAEKPSVLFRFDPMGIGYLEPV